MAIPEELKITIITVCKNSEIFLRETIESVINQTYKNIEYLVIDGKSTDRTTAIITHFSPYINYWISEEDSGMYDAINKGLKIATGDYILVLNSDDLLASNNTISLVVDQINKERLDYYHGNMIKLKGGKFKKVKLFPATFKQLLLSTHGTFVPHPCFLISKELNNILEEYDLKYKYASDYDYILRALSVSKRRGKYIDIYISKFRIHDNSITASGKINEEKQNILDQHGYSHYPLLTRLYFYYTLWIKYKIINISRSYEMC